MATLDEVWSLARLYEAGLNRNGELDRPGLNFWIDRLDDGFSFDYIASEFMYSSEFTRTAGRPVDNLSNREFVNTLYNNVLDRDGLDVGINAWTAAIDNGVLTREHVLYRFAVSPENVQGSRYVEDLRLENGDWWFPTVFDGVPDNASTTLNTAPGQFFASTIDFEGDRDWIAIDTSPNVEYTVDLYGDGIAGRSLADPYLTVLNSNGAIIVQNDDSNGTLNSQVSFTSNFGGRYYIEASGLGTSTGDYEVAVTSAGAADILGGPFTTSTVSAGQTVYSDIGFLGDSDWFELSANAETRYEISLFGSNGNIHPLNDPLLKFYDANGVELASNDDSGGTLNSFLNITPGGSGTYYIAASELGNNATGSYGISVNAFSTDIAGNTATSAVINANNHAQGSIDFNGDNDWFAIQLRTGSTYDINLDAASFSGLDPILGIYDHSGNAIVFDDDGGAGRNSYLNFTPSSDDVYYLEASGYQSSTGGYDLSVTESII